jgi:hypothetical protein
VRHADQSVMPRTGIIHPGFLLTIPVWLSRMLFLKTWLDAMRFGFEFQSVIALRLMKIAAGVTESNTDVTRMVTEKVKALADTQTASAVALAQGKSVKVASKRAMTPIKRRVRANHRRLKKK